MTWQHYLAVWIWIGCEAATLSSPPSLIDLEGEWMKNQRYPEGCTDAVRTRAEAYPLQGWFVRRQTTTPPAPHPRAGGRLHQSPPLRPGLVTQHDSDRGGWTGREVVIIPHQG